MLRFVAYFTLLCMAAAQNSNANVNGPCTITALPPFVGSDCYRFEQCMKSIQLAPRDDPDGRAIVSLTMSNATCMVTPTPFVSFVNFPDEARVFTSFHYAPDSLGTIRVMNTPGSANVTITTEMRFIGSSPTCSANATVTSGACMFQGTSGGGGGASSASAPAAGAAALVLLAAAATALSTAALA